MRRFDPRVAWGILLIIGGLLYLLQYLGLFRGALDLLWALILGGAGVAFLAVFLANRAQWWALIPGFTLLSVGVLIALGVATPRLAQAWGGLLVLGAIGVSFGAIYLADRRMWWAVIPAGVLLTLAVVTLLDVAYAGLETGGVFFLGLGLTFGLVGVLPTPPSGSMRWAFIPAGVLALMGLLILAAAEKLINSLWPAALILVGLYLIARNFRPRPGA